MENTLTKEQEKQANIWYANHRLHVSNILMYGVGQYPPTLEEDKNNPSIWKAEHWSWFLSK